MNYRGSYKKLLGNSKSAILASIEIYNKPRFDYRDEVFVFLIINAWELSLKALLSRGGQSIFYPKKRSQPYRTLTWHGALKRAVARGIWPDGLPNRAVEENLDLLNTYRDNVVHFYNAPGFGVIIHSLAQTSILNYRDLLRHAFGQELASDISWQLMPLGTEPPIDPLNFLRGIRSPGANTRAVEQFLTALKDSTSALEQEGVDTGRLLTTFDVSLQSVKKIEKADVIIGVDPNSAAEQVLVTRRMDPNITHPYRQTEVLEKLGGSVSPYTFQAVVWRHRLRDKPDMFWQDNQIENRYLALPDFQRSFVWDAEATRELVVSIIRSFPAGTLLQMEGGGRVFAPRTFEEAPALQGNPSHLILDGQQRMTSLYQAFSGSGTHRFFLNLKELLEGQDVDEAVEVYAVKRAKRWSTIDSQANDLMLPLALIRSFSDWRDEVLDFREGRGEEVKKLRSRLNDIEKGYVDPVKLYNFPVTTLSATTPVEAVCTIFETLNRTGVKLSVFELLTARAFAHNVKLRQKWEEALEANPVLVDFDVNPYYVLQIIAMNVKKSPKRSVVLSLEIPDIVKNWQEAIEGLAQSMLLVRDQCGVLVGKWLPYETMLITMASAWRSLLVASGPTVGAMRMKMVRWFWCGVFGQVYENSGNTMTERDVPDLRQWLEGGAEPKLVTSFRFDSNRWLEITVRQRALYRATIALLMRNSPRDFHNGNALSKPFIDGQAVDDHHIFPRKYLATIGKGKSVDCVVNHTLIDRKTNIRIGGRPPSDYLREMEKELGADLSKILVSHGLPPERTGPLFGNRFQDFLKWRLRHLEAELGEVSGGEVGPAVAPMELELHHEENDPGSLEPGVDQETVEGLLGNLAPHSVRPLMDALTEEVSTWPDVRIWGGKSSNPERRRIFFSRRGSPFGAFAWLLPRLGDVRLRLDESDIGPTRGPSSSTGKTPTGSG